MNKNETFRKKLFRGAKIEDLILHLNRLADKETNTEKRNAYLEIVNYIQIKFDYEVES